MFNRIRIFPLMIGLAVMMFGLKVTEVVIGVETVVTQATAADEGTDSASADDVNSETGSNNNTSQMANVDDNVDVGEPMDPTMMSRSELELLTDLSARRRELEKRSSGLDMRERLLEVTERRIDSKIEQLKSIEEKIESLVAKQDEADEKQMQSLVKIYSSMKAKSAARIMEELNLDVQVEVAVRMKESKMGSILAAMDPSNAKALTLELATHKKLPKIKG